MAAFTHHVFVCGNTRPPWHKRGCCDPGAKLVPLMRARHGCRLCLMDRCRAETGLVVLSIRVNPTQFGPTEDLARYPRAPELDNQRCASAGAALIFAPDGEALYPHGPLATFV